MGISYSDKPLKDSFRPKKQQEVQEAIKDFLKTLKIEKGYPSFIYDSEHKIYSLLKSDHFDISDIFIFLHNESLSVLDEYFKIKQLNRKEINTTLGQLMDVDELSKQITNRVLSYPSPHVIFVPLPNMVFPFSQPIRITDSITLLNLEEDIWGKLSEPYEPKETLKSALLGGTDCPSSPKRGITYLSVCFSGYFPHNYSDSSSNKLSLSRIRRILSALKVKGIFNRMESALMEQFPSKPLSYHIYDLSKENLIPQNAFLPHPLSEHLKVISMGIGLSHPEVIYEALNPGKKHIPSDSKQELLQKVIEQSNLPFLFSPGPTEEVMKEKERILTSIEWFFEGLTNENETFSFILFSTAIEALLGDPKNTETLVDRLSDRCSFLIAKDCLDRKKAKKRFKEAYTVRSNIIHRGELKLSGDDVGHYRYIEKTIKKLLSKEINNLPKPQ